MIKYLHIILVTVAVVLASLFFKNNSNKATPFYGDALGYYSYLPAVIINHNLDSIEKLPANAAIPPVVRDYFKDIESSFPRTPKGKLMVQYTYGVSAYYAPFFFIAKALNNDSSPHGFSPTYAKAIKIGNVFYLLLGCLLCFLAFKKHLPSSFLISAIATVFISSNLFWFGIQQTGMAHIIQFFNVALLLFLTTKFFKNKRSFYLFSIALVVGFITLVRPTDFVFILIPLCYGISTIKAFKERVKALLHFKKLIAAAILFFTIPIIPQLYLWQKLTGSWFYDSYGSQGFHFLNPKIIAGLFGWENGWLAYSPIFILSILPIILFRKNTDFRFAILLLPIFIYVNYSWFNVSYINGFGSRPMLHIYPLLIYFVGLLFSKIASLKKRWLSIALFVFCAATSFINLQLSHKQANDLLWSENANFNFVKSTLFKNKLSYNDLITFDNEIIQPTNLMENKQRYIVSNNDSTELDASIEFPEIKLSLPISYWQQQKTSNYIKCGAIVNCTYPVPDLYQNHLLVFKIQHKDKTTYWKATRINNKVGIDKASNQLQLHNSNINKWDTVTAFYKLPSKIPADASATLSLWNIGKKPIILQQLFIETY